MMNRKTVNVWLVGAGPGDVGLLTLRAFEVIERADVIIYDRLAGPGVLAIIPEGAERIDVGKIPGQNSVSQREIENLIISYAKENKRVVRLKGGDPFLFGRGGEEAEALINADIPFEVVPGVSSALAVPSFGGIPVTHRNFCSSVNIITAHDKDGMVPDFNDLKNGTKIFLMGVGQANELCGNLIASGISPDMPSAVIEQGTTARQRVIRTSLENVSEKIQSENIKSPAVIIVGNVAGLNLDWRRNLPLNKLRIAITRPAGRAEKLSRMLRDAGAEVILTPCIKTEIIPEALSGIDISGAGWVGFTSVTGVEALFKLLEKNNRDVRELGKAKIAAIGSATCEALKHYGLRVDYVPEVFDGKHLAEGLAGLWAERGTEKKGDILFFRAEGGTPDIEKVMSNHGIKFRQVCIYRTVYVKSGHIPKDLDMIIFTSASTVRGFVSRASKAEDFRLTNVVCIGKQTSDEAKRAGFINVITAKQATIEALFEAVMSCS